MRFFYMFQPCILPAQLFALLFNQIQKINSHRTFSQQLQQYRNHMTAPYFSQKISINQITQNKNLLNIKETPSLPPNHITWDEQSQTENYQLKQTQSRPRPQSRRKIFQKFESKYDSKKLVIQAEKVKERSKEKSGGKLHKVKSNPQVTFQDQRTGDQTELRIQQINRQLKQHRQNLANSKTTKRDNGHLYSDTPYWTKIEERLAQSKEILQRQEEILITKIPTFQKKIEDNSTAINEVTRLLRLKLQNQNHKVEGLKQMMEKNQDRLKDKQQELSRINSELLAKESQIMRNKEVNKRRELQLQRIKRIEDLQNKNLEIYQSIGKKGDLSQFADFKLQTEEMYDHGECWGDSVCESKVTVNKISTIQYSGERSHNYSENNTIGELLSPLALIDNQYVI